MQLERKTIITPDDWHLHLRFGVILRSVLLYTTSWCRRAIIMPNVPKIETTAQAQAYRAEIMEVVEARFRMGIEPKPDFMPLMTVFLTPNTDPDDLERGFDQGIITAVKRYPRGATTGSESGVEDLASTAHVFKRMEQRGIPLLCHDESMYHPGGELVDDYDRERVFFDTVAYQLVHDYPSLRISNEHIGKRASVAFMRRYGCERIVATVTPQHIYFDRRDRYKFGGNAPDYTCRPFIGREEDKKALWGLLREKPSYLFLGTDSAPHLERKKASPTECACGCFNAPNAIGMYAEVFEGLGILDYLEQFASMNGPRFYGLEPNTSTITLVKRPWHAKGLVKAGNSDRIRPIGFRHRHPNNLTVAWQQELNEAA